MRYPTDWLEDLRARADILSVVSEYVQLKQKGRSYWGLCPFHGEKTASFKVDPEHGLYYCFGCKAGGTVFDFVMGMERMDFSESVRYLADKFRVPLPDAPDDAKEEERRTLRENILRLNREAAMFFHKTLYAPEGAQALEYLHKRGLDDRTIRLFGMGASQNRWDALTKHLQAQGASVELLAQAGLTVRKEDRAFDMFRNRAMFPIIDARGSVLGFGGRAMGDVQPKYLNTADTPAFNKRHNVYAANLLRKTKNLKRVLLVEGYMDVVSLVSHGVEGAAATLGTSLTEEQARLLSRYAPEIWVAYDGDSAGQNAILRAIGIFDAAGIPCRVLVIPDGMDPDEFIRAHGKEAFDALKPMSGVMYRMLRARDGLDLSDEEGRAKYAMACAEILRGVTQPVELENLLKRLSVETGYSRDVLLQQIGIAPDKQHLAAERRREAPAIKPAANRSSDAGERAERTLLELMCFGLVSPDVIAEDQFENKTHRWLVQQLLAGQKPEALLVSTDDEARRKLLLEILASEPNAGHGEAMQMVAECVECMRREWIEKRIAALKAEMTGAQPERKGSLLKEIMMLTNEKKSLGPGRKE